MQQPGGTSFADAFTAPIERVPGAFEAEFLAGERESTPGEEFVRNYLGSTLSTLEGVSQTSFKLANDAMELLGVPESTRKTAIALGRAATPGLPGLEAFAQRQAGVLEAVPMGTPTMTGRVAGAAGSYLPVLPQALLGSVAAGPVGAQIATGLQSTVIAGQQRYQQSEQAGMGPGKRLLAGTVGGAAEGAVEALGSEKILGPLGGKALVNLFRIAPDEVKRAAGLAIARDVVGGAVLEGLEEPIQAGLASATQNWLASSPEAQKAFGEWLASVPAEMGESAATEGAAAALMSGLLGGGMAIANEAARVRGASASSELATRYSETSASPEQGVLSTDRPAPAPEAPAPGPLTGGAPDPAALGVQTAQELAISTTPEPGPEVAQGAPAQPGASVVAEQQPPQLKRQRLPKLEMTADELDAAAEQNVTDERTAIRHVFPELETDAEVSRKLRSSTLDQEMVDRGFDETSPEFAAVFLTEDPRHLRRLASERRNAEDATTPDEIAEVMASQILEAQRAQESQAAGRDLLDTETEALVRIRGAARAAQREGLDPKDVVQAIGRRLKRLGYTEEDADLFAPFFTGTPPAQTQETESGGTQAMEAGQAAPLLLEQASDQPTTEPALAASPRAVPTAGDLENGGEQRATGIKNRTVYDELAREGLPPPEKASRRADEDVYSKAKATFDADPMAGKRLVDELAATSRPHTDDEAALLTFEAVRLKNERRDAQDAFNQDPSPANRARIDAAIADYARFAEVADRTGTESGRSLRMRRMMVAEDFSLAQMEREAQVRNQGKPLSEAQSAEIKGLHDQIATIQRDLEDLRSEVQLRKVVEQVERKVQRSKPRRHVTEFLSDAADKARARIKARGPRAMAGIDPAEAVDWAIIGADYIAKDVKRFADWSKAMVAEIGEHIKPHLEAVFSRAQEVHDAAGKDAARLKGYKTRAQTRIDELTRRAEEEDFSKPAKLPLPLDDEAIALQAEMARAKREYRRALARYEKAHRSKGQVAVDTGKEVANTLKTIWSSVDFSAVLRQGAGLVFDPKNWAASVREHLPNMFKSALSEKSFDELMVRLEGRPKADLARRAGLEMTGLDETLGKREETLQSKWADHIPLVARSNRAFAAFINSIRAAAFDSMIDGLPGPPTLEQARELARWVNIATGRGAVSGKLSAAVDASGYLLWAPRLYLSRFQALAEPLRQGVRAATGKGDAATSKAIAAQIARSLGGLATFYALMMMTRDVWDDDEEEKPRVSFNPRSADFGKVVVGRTRIDPLAGLAQAITLLGRIATGETTSSDGRTSDVESKSELVARYVRGKLQPALALTWDLVEGKNVVGEETRNVEHVARQALPLSFRDIDKLMRERGIPEGLALQLLSIFGMGVQTYDERKPKKKAPAAPVATR